MAGTVGQLIEALKSLPPEYHVCLVNTSEDGRSVNDWDGNIEINVGAGQITLDWE